jgi:hypothetical protein
MSWLQRTAGGLEPDLDRGIINEFLGQYPQEGPTLWRKQINMAPHHQLELQRLVEFAEQKWNELLVPYKGLMWQYEWWEKNYGNIHLRFTWPNRVVLNGGNIQEIQATERDITLPEPVYHLVEWRMIIDRVKEAVERGGGEDATSATRFRQDLFALKRLVQ